MEAAHQTDEISSATARPEKGRQILEVEQRDKANGDTVEAPSLYDIRWLSPPTPAPMP
jgi:hypothetical protein